MHPPPVLAFVVSTKADKYRLHSADQHYVEREIVKYHIGRSLSGWVSSSREVVNGVHQPRFFEFTKRFGSSLLPS